MCFHAPALLQTLKTKKMDKILSDGIIGVEIRVAGVAETGSTQTQFNFNDQPYLRPDMASIQAIEVMTANSIATSPLSGTPLVPLNVMQKAFLTLYGSVPGVERGNEVIQRIPLLRFNTMQNVSTDPFSRIIIHLNDMSVDWTKSFVSLSTAAGNTVDNAFAFNVYFNYRNGNQMH